MKLVKRIEIAKPEIVYNLRVKQNHNYVANGAVVSNCHGAKAASLHTLLTEHGANIVHRFGLTGTLPDNKVDALKVHVSLGNVICEYSAASLIEKGWLATLNINVVQLNDAEYLKKHDVDSSKLLYEEEKHFCLTNDTRKDWIADFLIKNKENSKLGNTLVLVNNIKFGRDLQKLIPNSYFLHGKDKNKERDEIYDLFEDNDDLVVICTKQIAGVGLSIDRIFTLCFIDMGKSFINTIQGIGRGLRKGKDKDSVVVMDICSNLPFSSDHTRKRIAYYKKADYPYKKFLTSYTKDQDDFT